MQASERTRMIKLCLVLICLLGANGADSIVFHYARIGFNVTLPCVHASPQNSQYLSWYKQAAGGQPQIISSLYKSSSSNTFYNQFKDNKRFSVLTQHGFYNLNISNIQRSDSAIYFCAKTQVATTEFDSGTFLLLHEPVGVSLQQQNVSGSVTSGDSVTLNCTVHNVTSDKDHKVFWFRQDLKKSGGLGVLYIYDDNSNGRCVPSMGSDVKRCEYSLSKRNISLSDAGMYYCGVALCGEILLGKGTRLDVAEKSDSILMYCAAAALFGSVLLNIVLICIVCKTSQRKSNDCGEAHIHTNVPGQTVDSKNSDNDVLPYVALDFKKRQSGRRRPKSAEEETIYSAVKVSK